MCSVKDKIVSPFKTRIRVNRHVSQMCMEAEKNQEMRDIRSMFEQEEDYYEPFRVGNFYSNSYV